MQMKLNTEFVEVFRSMLLHTFGLRPESIVEDRHQRFGWLWTVKIPRGMEIKVFFKDPKKIRRGKRWSMVCVAGSGFISTTTTSIGVGMFYVN